jgi:hypothetical protein
MPMVQISHARLSSLVCDGNKGRGKIVVGVAAHYPLTTSSFIQGCTAPAKKAATACLLLLLLEADVDHFISPSSLHVDIIYIDIYARIFVRAHALRIFITRGTSLREDTIDTMKENNTWLARRRDTIQLVIILASNDS